MFNLKPDRVKQPALGQGAFGKVYPYQKDPTDMKYVIKYAKAEDSQHLLMYFQEIAFGFRCENPYILPVRGYYIEQNAHNSSWNIYLKLPRMNGSLSEILDQHKIQKKLIPERQIAQYFYQLAKGFEYLHKRGIAHRDIKPDNVLIDGHGCVKISDFGLGAFYGEATMTAEPVNRAGTPIYMAPEVMKPPAEGLHKKDLFMTDLWSLGLVMFELCTLSDLTSLHRRNELTEAGLNQKLNECKGKYSDAMINLISSLLRTEASGRNNLEDIQRKLTNIYGDGLIRTPDVLEIQKKLDAQSTLFQKMESKYEEDMQGSKSKIGKLEKIIKDQQLKLTRLEKKLEKNSRKAESMKDITTSLNELSMELEDYNQDTISRFKKVKLDGLEIERDSERHRIDVQTWSTSLIEKKWKRAFELKDFTKRGIALRLIDTETMEAQTFKSFMDDLTEMHQSDYNDSLEALSLELFNWSKCNQAIQDIGDQIGSKMRNLVHLELNASRARYLSPELELTDEQIKSLTAQISTNLRNLQQLTFNFMGHSNITDKAITTAVPQIAENLKNLKKLALVFIRCSGITDKGLIALGANLSSNLKGLELEFKECEKLTDQGVMELTSSISSRLKGLQHLHLNFSENYRIKFKGVSLNFEELQHLHLDFSRCRGITDKELTEFVSSNLPNLKELQHLHLDFSECGQFTDQGLMTLDSSLLSNFKGLQYLNLDFSNCKLLTDQSLTTLASAISSNLDRLQDLHLSFGECEKFTDQGLRTLASSVSTDLKKLQHIKLFFAKPMLSRNHFTRQTKEFVVNCFESVLKKEISVL